MKINKFIALAMIAVMAIGAMGFIITRAQAQGVTTSVSQVQTTKAPDTEQAVGADTDQVQEQVGDQNEQDASAKSGKESVETAGTDGQDTAVTGTPAVSADAALKAAQAYLNTTVSGTATLDDENGKLVYSVDLNGSDVKVDAMTGVVLGVDQVGEGQDSVN
jgi:uncharacterized membrane protein YkoI